MTDFAKALIADKKTVTEKTVVKLMYEGYELYEFLGNIPQKLMDFKAFEFVAEPTEPLLKLLEDRLLNPQD